MSMTESQLRQWFAEQFPGRDWLADGGQCQAVVVNAAEATGGLVELYPTAAAAAAASGWLNPEWWTAPAGACHYFRIPHPSGHVALDLRGGGRLLLQAFGIADQWWGDGLGTMSLPRLMQERPGWTYLGWARHNGRNTITITTTGIAGASFEEDDMQLTDPITPDTGRSDVNAYIFYTRRDVLEALRKLDALTAAVSALAVGAGLDPDALVKMIAQKVDAALADDLARIPAAVVDEQAKRLRS